MVNEQNGLENILVGKKIDTYIVDEPGKIGAFGIVYKVHRETQPTIFLAMKVYRGEFSLNLEFKKSLDRETESWKTIQDTEHQGKISLDNIVRVYETGTVKDTGTMFDKCAYLMMEYMDGGTLEDLKMEYMKPDPQTPDNIETPEKIKIDLKEALFIFSEAAKGIKAAHGAGTIHCDVHGRNILLNKKRNVVKIGDFGVAKIMKDISLPYTKATTFAKRYSAPEQDEGKHGFPTDVYLLGATMLDQLTNLKALAGFELKFSGNTNIPDSLKEIIKKCLAYEMEDRPNISKVIEELTSIRKDIIRREERYNSLIRDSTTALNQIGKKANSNKSKVLNAPDIEELYKHLRECYNTLNKEKFDTPVEELERIPNELLQRDGLKMVNFARQFDSTDIKVVSPAVAEMAKTYRQAGAKWTELTGKELVILLPEYTFKVE
jgi:serine/threonine protein kinase